MNIKPTKEEIVILKIMKNRFSMHWLTAPTPLSCKMAFREKPVYDENIKEWDSPSNFMYLTDVTFENIILDNDLKIDIRKLKFDWINDQNSPISIDDILNNR